MIVITLAILESILRRKRGVAQAQDSTTDQVDRVRQVAISHQIPANATALTRIARAMGCYDAADFFDKKREERAAAIASLTSLMTPDSSKPFTLSGPEVRAVLDGMKTQVRRVLKPQPAPNAPHDGGTHWVYGLHHDGLHVPVGTVGHLTLREKMGLRCPYGQPGDQKGIRFAISSPPRDGWYWVRWEPADEEEVLVYLMGKSHQGVDEWLWGRSPSDDPESVCLDVRSPGDIEWRRPGDRLWVRETWALLGGDGFTRVVTREGDQAIYQADGAMLPDPYGSNPRWRSPACMLRWASRLTLEVVDVRVQRLQDISEHPRDAWAEGCRCSCTAPTPMCKGNIDAFAAGWDQSPHGKRAPWESNPWVWALTFKVVP